MPKEKKQPLQEEDTTSNDDFLDWTFTDREELERVQQEEPGYLAKLFAWRLNGGKK